MFFNNQDRFDFNRVDQDFHVHELLGSTYYSERGNVRHNHRFANVTGPAIQYGGSHVHEIFSRTVSTDHFHTFRVTTGPAIDVGNGQHIHTSYGTTSFNDEHAHDFYFATLIEGDTN